MTAASWYRALRHKMRRDSSTIVAAGVAFFGALAVVPAMVIAVSIYGMFTTTEQAERDVDALLDVLPETTVRALEAQIHPIADFSHFHLSVGLVVSVAALLWTVSNASRAVVRAVVIAYEVPDHRSPLETRLASVGLTILVIVLGTAAVAMIAALPAWLTIIDPTHVVLNFSNLRWILIALFFSGGTTLLYRAAPPDKPDSWSAVLPGSLIATGLWIVISVGFSVYVASFARYNDTYGALGAGAILLLWFWLTALVSILGAQINFIRSRGPETAEPVAAD